MTHDELVEYLSPLHWNNDKQVQQQGIQQVLAMVKEGRITVPELVQPIHPP